MSKQFKFFVFNIKLQNNQSTEERTLRYRDLIKKISSSKQIFDTGNQNNAITMYLSHGDESNPYIYGRIAKGIHFQGNEIDALKNGQKETEINDPDSLKIPNTARYIFVPEAHRLCVEKKAKGPLAKEVEKYLLKYLTNELKHGEKIEILIEKDEKTIEKILSAKRVFEIQYKISYTNEDINSAMDELFDQDLKDSNIGVIEVSAKADNDVVGLNIIGTPILEGGIKLAQSNGEIKKAVIIPKGGQKKETISNNGQPKVLNFQEEDKMHFWKYWYDVIMKKYRTKNA